MSSLPPVRSRPSLVQEWIRRFISYTDEVSWFGPNSAIRAWAVSTAGVAEGVYLLYAAVLRRFTLLGSSGEALRQVARERGCEALEGTYARLLVIVSPEQANVSAITAGITDLIEVDDSSPFLAGDTIRIRNGDGTVTETATIIAITVGTGPGGGDELEVAPLVGAYTPATDDVDVLARVTVPAGTSIATSVGVTFTTTTDVTTSDANPILDGESTFVGLADKAWAECDERGERGNIDPLAVTGLVASIRGVRDVSNPDPGAGGHDEETDLELKYRAMHRPTGASQETAAWLEELARLANPDLLRARTVTSTTIGSMEAVVLRRNGGAFTTAELDAMETWLAARVRSYLTVSLSNVTLTSIEVEATITLDPGATLEGVGKAAAAALAAFLDFRKWAWGTSVDEAELLSLVNNTAGVATLQIGTFLPAADVTVAANSLPTLVRLSLLDEATGDTWNADLAVGF